MRTAEVKSNKNDPRGCERNLSNCVGSLKKIQDFNRWANHTKELLTKEAPLRKFLSL